MRSMFLAGVLVLAAADLHPQERERYCGRTPSLADITYVCGKGGGYVRLTSVIMAMNAKVGATRYATINEVHLHFYGSVTVPTSESAFVQWVQERGLNASRNEKAKMITFRLPSKGWIEP
jgi:hypothetical protein